MMFRNKLLQEALARHLSASFRDGRSGTDAGPAVTGGGSSLGTNMP